jgi:regulator of protease activity HflC (stomatin/prohibitin superfamily)
MRSAIGEMELDEILHGRARLNALIKGSLQEAAIPWGLEVRRYEITEITPDHQIRIAMDKQAAAERDRREHVLRAEGDKQRAQLTSEGVKISLTNESEGNLIKVKNEAEASKQRILLEAEGQAKAIRLMSEAQADALALIAAQINKPGGDEAARLALAREYVSMYGEMGSKSNTIMFNDRPADINALLSQAMVAMRATQPIEVGRNDSFETERSAKQLSSDATASTELNATK